jgi:hypothetical protein
MQHNIITNIATAALSNFKEESAAQVQEDQMVKLNIGGTPVYTFYKTLTKHSNFFKEMFQKSPMEHTLVNGNEIFVDRDPIIFTTGVMNYLRSGMSHLPTPTQEHTKFYESLKEEAQFYQMEDLVAVCNACMEEIEEKNNHYIMDFSSLKDLTKSRGGKTYGDFEYIDVDHLDGKNGAVHLISILRATMEGSGYVEDEEDKIYFLVRKKDI